MWKQYTLVLVLIGLVLAGCATIEKLPPVKPIQDLKSLEGDWEGTETLVHLDRSIARAILTFKMNGSFRGRLQPGAYPEEAYSGDVRVKKGKLLYTTANPRWTAKGVFVLHEGDGKTVLVKQNEDGKILGRYKPVNRD
jgi:hypothetical protein